MFSFAENGTAVESFVDIRKDLNSQNNTGEMSYPKVLNTGIDSYFS